MDRLPSGLPGVETLVEVKKFGEALVGEGFEGAGAAATGGTVDEDGFSFELFHAVGETGRVEVYVLCSGDMSFGELFLGSDVNHDGFRFFLEEGLCFGGGDVGWFHFLRGLCGFIRFCGFGGGGELAGEGEVSERCDEREGADGGGVGFHGWEG